MRGPVQILCDEIGFPFDSRLERADVLVAFVAELVGDIGSRRSLHECIAAYTAKPPSEAGGKALDLARRMVRPGVDVEERRQIASRIHNISHGEGFDCLDDGDHDVDMLASCASAIRFGLETPCRSRHAADAADHVWKQTYGVSRFDRMTPAWRKDWACQKLQSAIISLLPDRATQSRSTAEEGEG